jgi:hypothetical protein
MSYCPGIIPERIEENHEEPQPEWLVLWLRFEQSTSQIQVQANLLKLMVSVSYCINLCFLPQFYTFVLQTWPDMSQECYLSGLCNADKA